MNQFLNQLLAIPTASAQSNEVTGVASKTGDQIQGLLDTLIHAIPLWITGGIVIVISFILARIVKSAVENKMTEQGLEEDHREVQIVAGRTASAVVLIIGITAGLKIAGLDLTPIIAAMAFGVGFAMKDFIMNFFAGIIVLLQKQFTIGDWVKVGKTEGVIKAIQSRYTIIKKFDGTNVIVPNADLFKKQVNSLTTNPIRRFQIDINIDLYINLKDAIDLIYKSINSVDKILKTPKPNIIVTQPGKFYNNLRIRCWVDSKKGVLKPTSALVRQIHKDFYRKGWSWPYPTQNIIFDKDMPPSTADRAKSYVETNKKKRGKKIVVTTITPNQAVNPVAQANPLPSTEDVSHISVPVVLAPVVQQAPSEQPMAVAPLPDVQPPINL